MLPYMQCETKDGYYQHNDGFKKCTAECVACTKGSIYHCTEGKNDLKGKGPCNYPPFKMIENACRCVPPLVSQSGACVDPPKLNNCDKGYFGPNCAQECHNSCDECEVEGRNGCSKCYGASKFNEDKETTAEFKEMTGFTDVSLGSCDCGGDDTEKLKSGLPAVYHHDKEKKVCFKCHWSCEDCKGPGEQDCTSCYKDLSLFFKPFAGNDKNACSCHDGYQKDEDNEVCKPFVEYYDCDVDEYRKFEGN